MQGEQMANLLRQQQTRDLRDSVMGSIDPKTGKLAGGMWDMATDWWNSRDTGSTLLDPTNYGYDQRYQNVPDYQDVATGIDFSNYNVLDDANYS
jgi:hypothetical protein